VKTADGVRDAFQFTKDLLVHGGSAPAPMRCRGCARVPTVVVHYTANDGVVSVHEIDRGGDEGLHVTEGMVTRIDGSRKEIVVWFDNGTSEMFRLTEHAAADVGKDLDRADADATRIVGYCTDESGQKVARFFRKTA